ncbi:MAG: hypothetical protein AUI93_00140 [Crenarchaeota archaeon 13_1_40CM_3_52_10]|nr:MAG: hypothetical protein AUI93_00140 [Crenarchaeota archaeon 13_1_40CM_3_52_10]
MDRLRRFSGYARIKTGPSPEDNALLQLTRELSVQFQIPYWYRQIVWGRLDRYNSTGWIISKPTSSSKETVSVPGSLPVAELMLAEFLKGRLSQDEWKILIALHLVRFKAYNQGRMSRLLGKIALAPRGLFFLLLFYIPAAASGGLSGPVLYFPSPILLLAALWIRRSLRKSLKRREFELDRNVARQLGTEQISQVLEKVENLDQKRIPTDLRFFFLPYVAYWNPSVKERIGELNNPRVEDLLRPSRIPKIGLRGRVITILVGLAIFWGSGLVVGNIYARGQTTVVCMDTLCSALVVIAAVGFWMVIIGGISIVIWIVRRFL